MCNLWLRSAKDNDDDDWARRRTDGRPPSRPGQQSGLLQCRPDLWRPRTYSLSSAGISLPTASRGPWRRGLPAPRQRPTGLVQGSSNNWGAAFDSWSVIIHNSCDAFASCKMCVDGHSLAGVLFTSSFVYLSVCLRLWFVSTILALYKLVCMYMFCMYM